MVFEFGEYKGHKLIVIADGRSSFQFGKTKAKLVLDAIEGKDRDKFIKMLKEIAEGE